MSIFPASHRFAWLCVTQLAAFVVGAQHPTNLLQRRDQSTSFTTLTVTGSATTVTVNPLDPTITRSSGWTSTVGPPPLINTITSSCITYSFILPPASVTVITETVTSRSTATVTDTNRPLVTQYAFPTPTVTVTTPRGTLLSYHCLNTLVVSIHDYPGATYTYTQWEHLAYVTGVCLTSSTRSTTIPGITLPTGRTLEDWEYFTSTTLATKHSIAVVELTDTTLPGTGTSTICKNPSPTVMLSYTVTRQPATTTVYTAHPFECTTSRSKSPRELGRREESNTPVEVHTVVYTTVTVIDNTVMTLTGTAVVDVITQSFPKTYMTFSTTTGTGTATYISWVCSLPSTS